MRFTLKAPCKDCPFRNDKPKLKGWLGEDRATEIDDALSKDGAFPCHKTLGYCDDTGDRIVKTESIFCGGALIYLHKQGRLFDNAQTRIGAIFKMYAPDDLDMNAPVFDTKEDFINFHT